MRHGPSCSALWRLLVGFFVAAPALAQQSVELPSLDGRPDRGVALSAQWYPVVLNTGEAAPAFVLLHGCGGLWTRDRHQVDPRLQAMALRLNAWGVHALAVDSLTPRGETELCTQKLGQRRVTQAHRRRDALGALAWLARQPAVDAGRLGMMGWSNGGSTVLAATNGQHAAVQTAPVKASLAVAFYPGCDSDSRRGYAALAPLLILIGAEDDWTPASACQTLARTAAGLPVALEVYPGAHHGFDGLSPVRRRSDVPNGVHPGQGVHVGGHAPSREAAHQRLADFVKLHWNLP